MIKQTLLGVSATASIAPGTLIGGRFMLGPITTMVGLIQVHDSKDEKTQRPVSLWMIPTVTMQPEAVEATRKALRGAAAVTHKDLVVPFGSSVMSDGTLCVATEPLGATSIADLISKKRSDKAVHSLAAAYPLVAHITNALTHAHASLAHGAVCPNVVRIDAAGHVKLAGLGLLTPLLALGATQSIYIAPEVRKGATPTAQSDIYSIGAILYELLTGEPVNPEVPPSSLVPGLGATLDIIVESCLAEEPADRFESVEALKGALAALVAPSERPNGADGLDIDIEFDEDAVPANATPHEPRPSTIPPGRMSAPQVQSAHTAAPGEGDLGSLLTAVTRNDSDRWMFSHGGLDHGPITARDLIAAVLRGEVDAEDMVLNMDSSERKKLLDWPQYREFAETAADKRRHEVRKANAVAAIEDEGVKKASRTLIAGTAMLMVLMIGGVYYKTLGPGSNRHHSATEIDDLVTRGELHVQTQSIQLLPPPPPSPTHHGGGGGGGGGGGSYEAAMSAPIDFNFGNGAPSGGTLSDAEIVRPLNASLGRFAGCLADRSVSNVTLRIAIGGNGRAIGVTVVNGSGAVKSCVAGVVRSLSWRAFGGPRVGLSWGFGF